MSMSTPFFIFAFFPVILVIYYLLKPLPILYRNIWLLIVSLFLYAFGAPKVILILVLSVVLNYLFGIFLDHYRGSKYSGWLLAFAILVNLSALFFYKYTNFATSTLNSVFGDSITVTTIILPIGISFFTFRAVSYVIDVYRGNVILHKNPIYVGLYITFFPQLISGPIDRYSNMETQIADRKESVQLFSEGIIRFVQGFCKKIIIADSLAILADATFDGLVAGDSVSAAFAWLGAIAFTLQIYFDFSGYSDMAIGIGKMFGFKTPENFNFPYIASSITDFWHRWHISLSTWFRDYIYFPLGGSRVPKKSRLVFNLFVVWILTGIWHGAEWKFVLWGLFYFVLLTFEKLTGWPKRFQNKVAKILYRVATLFAIVFGWVIFKADGIHSVIQYLKSMFVLDGNMLTDANAYFYVREYALILIAALLLSTPLPGFIKEKCYRIKGMASLGIIMRPLIYMFLFIYAVSSCILNTYNPFIYNNF